MSPALLCAMLAVLLLSLAGAPSAGAAGNIEPGNSFSELSQKAQEEESTTTTSSTTGTAKQEVRNNDTVLLLGIGGAVVLLVAVAYVIVRDARRAAPAGADDFSEGRKGTDPVARQRNRRAKAKAAKAQRKRNR